MNNLVTINQNNQAITTSLMVAETFNKQHKDILKSIKTLDIPEDFNERNFSPVKYLDKKGEERPMYEITRDGFTLLAMGFTGAKAMEFKIKYINAFNEMAEMIAAQRPEVETEIDDISLDYDAGHIDVAEFELRAVKVIAQLFGRDVAKSAYMSSKYLPKPTFLTSETHEASARACLEYLKTMPISGYPLAKVINHRLADMLKPFGLDLLNDGLLLAVATSSTDVAAYFANTRWAQNWRQTLLELPGATRSDKPKRFGKLLSKYYTISTAYFAEVAEIERENAND